MSEGPIPKGISDLIARHVRSVGHLEALLFLHSTPGRWCSAEEVAKEMRTNPAYAEQQLKDLLGPVKRQDGEPVRYCYEKGDDAHDAAMAQMAELYRSHRHALINAIYAQPIEAIRSFADAFKLKKDYT